MLHLILQYIEKDIIYEIYTRKRYIKDLYRVIHRAGVRPSYIYHLLLLLLQFIFQPSWKSKFPSILYILH